MASVLLIDDDQDQVERLAGHLRDQLEDVQAKVTTWVPTKSDSDLDTKLRDLVGDDTVLVVADYDLTSNGSTGLFGSTVVSWCQTRMVPVGDYSRRPAVLPHEPDLFELRIPTDTDKAAHHIVALFRGFQSISASLADDPALLSLESPSVVLARIVKAPGGDDQFGLYPVRAGTAGRAILDNLGQTVQPIGEAEKRKLLSYITGHLLVNSVLRFPGPLVSEVALGAYLATTESDAPEVTEIFEEAIYEGPFHDLKRYYWIDRVDAVLERLAADALEPDTSETMGELNRTVLERKLGRQLARPKCPRCSGKNGGFFCPFTNRTVCTRPDCSTASSGWIPPGASLCRIEREFFDEWSPLLGI